MSINKIHVNNSTKISLNDRFTIMQSVGVEQPSRRYGRRRTQSISYGSKASGTTSVNRMFLEQLDKKHKIKTALKLKRRSLKAAIPAKHRIRNFMSSKNGVNNLRKNSGGGLMRSNSLTNIATMKADLLEPKLRRSNSVVNLAARLGMKPVSTNRVLFARRPLKRNSFPKNNSKPNETGFNKNVRLGRSRSKTNLRRVNSKQDISKNLSTKPFNRNRSRSRNSEPNRGSVKSRLDIRRSSFGSGNRGIAYRLRKPNISQGRIFKTRNATQSINTRLGRYSHPRGRRGAGMNRGGVRSRSKIRKAISTQRNRGNRNVRSRGTYRGSGIRRPSVKKTDINKEVLDKELDQYMANTKNDMHVNMTF